jgi:DNA polymerase-4
MDEDTRRIIHVDMDAFCAQIEQRDFPNQYAGEPIAVGGTSPRGVVQTASYEARPYGVHSAQPAVEAERKCPDLIFVPPRMDGYQQEARRIREVLRRYTDVVEPLSSDEVYLDVTDPKQGPSSGTLIARRIREEIYEKTNLTASAGAEQVRRESCFRPGQARRADNHRADRPARVYRGSFR